MIFPFGAPFRLPNDDTGHKLSQALFENADLRDRLTQGMYIPRDLEEGLGFLEATVDVMRDCEPLVTKVREATYRKIIDRHQPNLFQQALDKNIINASDKNKLDAMEIMKTKAIQVDEFLSLIHIWRCRRAI